MVFHSNLIRFRFMSLLLKSAHVAQNAFGTIGIGFVRMATTFALTIDVFAFAIRQILHQIFHASFAPIGQFDSRGHGFHFLNQRLTDERRPITIGTVHIWNGAHFGASRAVVATARLLIHVDMEATVFFVAFTASYTETAHAAFVGQFEAGRRWYHTGYFAFIIQFAMIFETVDDIGYGKPQTLTPFVWRIESWTRLRFFNFHAFGAFFIGLIRMATTFATTVLLDAISFGHH